MLEKLATDSEMLVSRHSKAHVRVVLGVGEHAGKEEVAKVVADRLLILKPRLPEHRRSWESERYAMAIFVAGALALTQIDTP
jgi:hypothetical protein